ncbi:Cdc42-like protein [Mycena amicta]|nr:Cdc42-like protein [Mycena amicta]
MQANLRKVVVVGDGAVGKTCLLIRHATGVFPTEYVPCTHDPSTSTFQFEGETYGICFFDTGGGEDYDRLRPLSYPQTDAFLLCYCVTTPASFANIKQKWIPELNHFSKDVPVVLVATQMDKRDDEKTINRLARTGQKAVTTVQGQRLAVEVGAVEFLECSALENAGVRAVFDAVGKAVVQHPQPLARNRHCVVV